MNETVNKYIALLLSLYDLGQVLNITYQAIVGFNSLQSTPPLVHLVFTTVQRGGQWYDYFKNEEAEAPRLTDLLLLFVVFSKFIFHSIFLLDLFYIYPIWSSL